MIVFDGISLESVAPVMIEDIRVSPVEVNVIERPRAIFPGSEFIRTRYGQRTVAITFGILEDDRAKRESALLGISQWANLLGDDFLRIHRSYLVNIAVATLASPDSVTVCGTELPVSRKYKDSVHSVIKDSGSSPE